MSPDPAQRALDRARREFPAPLPAGFADRVMERIARQDPLAAILRPGSLVAVAAATIAVAAWVGARATPAPVEAPPSAMGLFGATGFLQP